ncbi:Glyoxylase, beta-lactamase superfamily II [Chryseolinea serpens]|uniref:Glyoxylase, beta-lactamase superfamily II n=1 Tax=Chryseolinea serpens TaxID=947013 RepID=A0A1M5QVV7_9BACT|nr:MBL fold metallo-hydrolase [Chryseolinea serpens]SHH17870.1 Glyoxylase, beta-lactamase superfamily II [Chryseolinea serpens]
MKRRTLLKRLALIAGIAAVPFKILRAEAATIKTLKRPFHPFKVGALELMVLTDGHIALSPVQPTFPNGSEQAEKALLQKHFRSTEAVDLSMNLLIIKKENDLILVDTGTGGNFGPASGWMLASMADAGISPETITHIVISHAHPDHVGGLLTKEGTPVFPHAQVHIARLEHEFWMAPQQDFSKSKFQDKKLLAAFTASTQTIFKTLQEKVHLFEHGAELLGCLRMELAPGHTPGHTLVHVYSGSEELVHVADLLHSDVLSFQHPEWGFNGDTNFELAMATRKKILANLTQGRQKTFGYHLPWPGIGHVRKQGEGYEWVAEAYAFPE